MWQLVEILCYTTSSVYCYDKLNRYVSSILNSYYEYVQEVVVRRVVQRHPLVAQRQVYNSQ